MFNKIYIVCPTYGEDAVWGPLDDYVNSGRVKILDTVNENTLKKIWNNSRQLKRSGENTHTLIYFDDCADQDGFKQNGATGVVNQLTTKGNHSNISTIYVVQRIVFASPTMRVNAECIITFFIGNEEERRAFFKEYGVGTFKNFTKLMQLATKEPYNTLFVDRQGPGEARYYHNFKLIRNPHNIENSNKKQRRA